MKAKFGKKEFLLIGKNVKKARLKTKISQLELAKKLGCRTASNISNIEKGQTHLGLRKLVALGRELKTTASQLIQGL